MKKENLEKREKRKLTNDEFYNSQSLITVKEFN